MCTSSIPDQYRPAETTAEDSPTGRSRAPEAGGRSRKLEYPPAPEPLPYPVMDNHTHLDFRDGQVAVSITDAMDAAEAVGVGFAVQVGTDLESSRFTVEAVDQDRRLLGAVAIHPNEAPLLAEAGTLEDALAEIEQLAHHPRIRAIGETGLDYFRTGEDGRERQEYSFRRHLDIARRLDLALQIHDRDAHDDVVKVLRSEEPPARVVFHCFSGDAELARICNENGWFMSFSGTVTFKNARGLRDALEIADPALILTETDAPFLTPHPFRGQPNATYAVPYTVRFMAEHLGADLEGFCRSVNANTRRAYGEWD